MNREILIVGQSLAATCLSYALYKRGIKHKVICNNKPAASSKVAAGIYNPIVFKRITKSWMIDALYPSMLKTYEELEKLLKVSLIHPLPIAKLIKKDEYQLWTLRIESQHLDDYFNSFVPNQTIQNINKQYDFAVLNKTGYLNIKKLLTSYGHFLKSKEIIIEASLNYELLKPEQNMIA